MTFKNEIHLCLCFDNIVYKSTCARCSATYYGETRHHFKFRSGKHSGISPLMNKLSKSKNSTDVKDPMWYQLLSFDDFKSLASSNSEFLLKIKKRLPLGITVWPTYFELKWITFTITFVWLVTQIFNSLIWLSLRKIP